MKSIVRDEVLESDLIALIDDKGYKVTYRELADKARNLSQCIEERSLIFFLCDRQTETIELLYEILYLNQVPLLLPADIDWELFENLLGIYKPQYIYCDKNNKVSERYDHRVELERHTLLNTNAKRYPIHPDLAVLLSTSGTTGSPKLVKLSYDNLYYNAESVNSHLGIKRGQKGISPLPINYVYGLNFCIWHWHCGATLLVTEESVLSEKFHDFYKKEMANNFAGTPYIYQMLQRVAFWKEDTLSSLHRAMSAGTQMSDEDQINLVSLMKEKFWMLYGQTESTGVVIGTYFDESNIKIGSIGRSMKHANAFIDDKTHELLLEGNGIFMGYANKIEQLAGGNVNQGMLLHTGDAASIDNEGYIYLNGRLTRYIKILGKRISLDDIEKYLTEKFGGVEFACTGIDDFITIYYTDIGHDLDKDIKMLLDSRMKIPKKFVSCFYIEKLPRNSSGKIMYAKLEK